MCVRVWKNEISELKYLLKYSETEKNFCSGCSLKFNSLSFINFLIFVF